jgi:hypothetical protein
MVLLPAAMVDHLRGTGLPSVTLRIDLHRADPSQTQPEWLTVTEAAKRHLDDVDGMTLARAKVKISRACEAGLIIARGRGRDRRVDPVSLDSWRLTERERDLNQAG